MSPLKKAVKSLFYPGDEYEQVEKLFQEFKNGDVTDYEMILTCKNGDKKTIEWNSYNQTGVQGAILEIVGFGNDVTQRKLAEEQIKNDLLERETLLRELYHRTKNNMQVVISLLKLKTHTIQDTFVHDIFSDVTAKIMSMALVHEMLYKSKNLSEINLGTYIEQISRRIIANSDFAISDITLRCELQDVMVNIDVAVPFGMVLSELLTNTLKHAFTGMPNNKQISISLYEHKEYVKVRYSDNGKGTGPSVDLKKSGSMGMQTIYSIIEHQLSGSISYNNNSKGLQWDLSISKYVYKSRI